MESKIAQIKSQNKDLSPLVLKSLYFTQGANLPTGYRLRERYVYDYELELIVFSEGAMVIGDHTYPVRQGDVIFSKTRPVYPRYYALQLLFCLYRSIRQYRKGSFHL
jgi:hypothetical protein